MSEVFDFINYKEYLTQALADAAKSTRGIRTQFAEAVQIQSSYVTKVLDANAHLSLEQADRAASFLGLTESENQYFILLVEFARASTANLKSNFEKQIKQLRQKRVSLQKTFKIKSELSDSDKNIFYSSWRYAAVMHALSIPKLKTKEAVAKHFQMPLAVVADIFEFLVRTGMVKIADGKVAEVRGWDWLTRDRALIARDHSNWRLMAIRAFENQSEKDIHYSSVISLSEEDTYRLKKMILEMLENSQKIIAASKEETVCSLLIDFFEL